MSKYYSAFLLSAGCVIAILYGASQLFAQQPDPLIGIVNDNTTLVARVAPEALDAWLYRASESKETTSETTLEKRLRQTKEILDGQPVWVTADWPRVPTRMTINVADPDGEKVNQLIKLWNVDEEIAYAGRMYMISVQAISDNDLRPIDSQNDRWKSAFSATFSTSKSPINAAMLPPAHLYRTLEELSIELPDYLGGGPATALTEGALEANVALDPSEGSIDGSFESDNAEAAVTFKKVLETARTSGVERLMKASDESWTRGLAMVAKEIKFSVEGNRVLFRFEQNANADSAGPIQKLIQAITGPVTRSVQVDRLRAAALGVLNYESAHQHFPPQGELNKADKGKGLSWRVHILPYLGKQELAVWKKFKLDQPWDSPHNKKLLDEMPNIYRGSNTELAASSDDERGLTTMVAPISGKTVLGSPKFATFGDIADGSSNTILLVVIKNDLAVPWTAPQDYKFDPANPGSGLKLFGNKTPVAMCDGSVMSADKENDWLNLFQMNDGEVVNIKMKFP